jgi:hypothetical protein
MGFLLHPSCEQIVFTMINSGVLIMLVVEWLEDGWDVVVKKQRRM